MISLEKRIHLERRNRPPNEITDLNLDNSKATEIEGLTDEYSQLENLSLINVGLQTLRGLPSLPALKRLELSDNRINGGLHILVENCPGLESLTLSGNKIRDLDTLKPLANLPKLRILDLYTCEICAHLEDYRNKVFDLLPQLVFLDGFDAENRELPEESDEEEEDDPEDEDGDYEDDEDEEDGIGASGDAVCDEDDGVAEYDDEEDEPGDEDDGEEGEEDDEEEEEENVGIEELTRDDELEDDVEEYVPHDSVVDGDDEEEEEDEVDDEEEEGDEVEDVVGEEGVTGEDEVEITLEDDDEEVEGEEEEDEEPEEDEEEEGSLPAVPPARRGVKRKFREEENGDE